MQITIFGVFSKFGRLYTNLKKRVYDVYISSSRLRINVSEIARLKRKKVKSL